MRGSIEDIVHGDGEFELSNAYGDRTLLIMMIDHFIINENEYSFLFGHQLALLKVKFILSHYSEIRMTGSMELYSKRITDNSIQVCRMTIDKELIVLSQGESKDFGKWV